MPVCAIAYAYASQFSAASIGESFAKNIGLDYQKVVLFGVTVVALLSSAVVMIVGVIPFLGLIVPNVVSLFMGDNIKRNLPLDRFLGRGAGLKLRYFRPCDHLPLRSAYRHDHFDFGWRGVYLLSDEG